MLAGLWTGSRYEDSWHDQTADCDFYDIKGVVEGLLNALQIDGIQFTRLPDEECTYTSAGHTAHILSNDTLLGLVGEIHSQVLANYDLKQPAFLFELHFDQLLPLIKDTIQFKPIPKIVAEGYNQAEALVESFKLLDVFEGKPIAEGKKSVSLRVTYRSPQKTLQDEDVTPIHQSIANRLVKAFNASLPA
jgi:phenylalanyl-tRNA synthetase beta chain